MQVSNKKNYFTLEEEVDFLIVIAFKNTFIFFLDFKDTVYYSKCH